MTARAVALSPLETAVNEFGKRLPLLIAAAMDTAIRNADDVLAKEVEKFASETGAPVTLHLGPRQVQTRSTFLQISKPIDDGLILSAWAAAALSFLFFAGFDDMALFIIDRRGAALQLYFSTSEDLHWRRLWTMSREAVRQ